MASPVRLRARWVVPVDVPPFENGEVVVDGGRIVAVGPATGGGADQDFGSAAILPGLVNAHSHLQYTVFRGFLDDLPFFPWIRTLTALKACLGAEDWNASAQLGAAEMLAAGVTTVGDCADAAEAVLDAVLTAGLRGMVFQEVFGIAEDPPVATVVADAKRAVAALRARAGAVGRVQIGLSPHAPYTVRGPLLRALAEYASRAGLRQAIHVAETLAESALIRDGAGPFAEMFARRGVPWTPTGGASPVEYVDEWGTWRAAPGALAVHAVHVSEADAVLLARRGVSVAHCPKSNGKLGAGIAPLRVLREAGVTVGLGTDSVASNNSVDLWEEMRAALFSARARTHDTTALTAADALALATVGGARALGMGDDVGTLTPGKRADLCVVDLGGLHTFPASEDDPVAALVYGARASDTLLTMVDGQVLYDARGEPRHTTLDVPALRDAVRPARRRLRDAAPVGTSQEGSPIAAR